MSTVTEIQSLIHDLIDTSSSDFPVARMVRGMNKAQDKIVNIILQKESLGQYDDTNYTDLAEGYLNIVSGQEDYSLKEDENFADLLTVHKVYVLGSATATEYVEIEKKGKFKTAGTGIPTAFRLNGKTLIFDIEPNYSSTNGIYVQFSRIPKPILTTDTTRELGMPVTYHHLVALYTAYDFARAKRMDNANDILAEILREEVSLGLHIGKQDFNANLVISPETVDSI